MLLLISSTMLLFHSDYNPHIPTSVYKFISSDEALDSLEPPNYKKTTTDDVEETNESIPLDIRLSNQELGTLETEEIRKTCDANRARLKVYMYDMPPEFHFGLLGWKGKLNKIWPDVGNISAVPSYPGGLNKQHSIEYWLTLDLLSSNNKNIARPCSAAIRVQDSSQADVVFVPFFAGTLMKDEKELYYLMKDEKDVHFTFGSLSQRNGARQASQGMESSKFCLNIAGDTPSSNRLFDAIVSHCVPVIISDDIELPYEDVLNYSEFSVFVLSSDALKKGFLVKLLRGIQKDEWTKMWRRLKEVANHFEDQFPSQQDDAVDIIWQAVARKLSGVSNSHRKRKYRNSQGVFEQ